MLDAMDTGLNIAALSEEVGNASILGFAFVLSIGFQFLTLPHTYSASPCSLEEIEHKIERVERERDSAQLELKRLDASLRCLHVERDRLQVAKNYALNMSKSPVYRLPDEIISLILLHTQEPRCRVSQEITDTCSRWRNVALDTSIFWTYIDYKSNGFGSSPSSSDIARIKAYISRSKSLPVMIFLRIRDESPWGGGPSADCRGEDFRGSAN